MALELYRKKRDFKTTPEPKGKLAKAKKRDLVFVIQKHAATRLHYDFRLELSGVLLSWAVPKGPSLDPNDKRLAMHVEDHPLEYGDLQGEKLQGGWTLVKSHGSKYGGDKAWLLFKEDDEYALTGPEAQIVDSRP